MKRTSRTRLPALVPAAALSAAALLAAPALAPPAAAGPSLAAQEEMSPKGGGDAPYQDPLPTPRGSDNIEVVGHIPLGAEGTVADLEMEQDPGRPLAYVSRRAEFGITGVSLEDPARPEVVWDWRIENEALHRGRALDVKYFSVDDRTYVVQGFQFQQGGPDADLGAVVWDVTALPDGEPEEVGRIRYPEAPGGFHNLFMYKHSDGRALLFATTTGDHAAVFDMERFLDGAEDQGLVKELRLPSNPLADALGFEGYHDFYVGWHPESGQDRFYGGGGGGWYVFDVTDLQDPELLATVTGVSGVLWGHTITPGPGGRYFVGETEYQYAPLRIFDLQPALDGESENVRMPISAWTADWRNLAHNHEMRWPYVFVSAYEDGLQVFNMRDPENPFTVAYYDTFDGRHLTGGCASGICNGAFGVDVRNHDGLIGISDKYSGLWLFRMEGFGGWEGSDWGVPDISSVQDWDDAPGGG